MSAIVDSPSSSANVARMMKFAQCAALLTTSAFLFRSAAEASFSDFFNSQPNSLAAIWGNLETAAALLLVPTSFVVLTGLRFATLAAIGVTTLACSIYMAQEALVLVDRFSDQTYLLLNPYLKDANAILPLVISIFALTISISRLRRYQAS